MVSLKLSKPKVVCYVYVVVVLVSLVGIGRLSPAVQYENQEHWKMDGPIRRSARLSSASAYKNHSASSNQIETPTLLTASNFLLSAFISSEQAAFPNQSPANNSTVPNTTNAPRLELLHIQKNAGSLLELLGMEQNISWGICHFWFPWKQSSPFKNCPPLQHANKNANARNKKQTPWHYPLQYLEKDGYPTNPYDNHWDPDHVTRPKRFFAIVRNPYERLVSMFHHRMKKPKHYRGKNITSDLMNEWLQSILLDGSKVGLFYPNSTICQYPYFYDESTTHNTTTPTGSVLPRNMVDHVLQFEYLQEDFRALAKLYGINMTIPEKKINSSNKTLTVDDLSNQTIDLLHKVCPKDFELGRKYTKRNVTVVEPNSTVLE